LSENELSQKVNEIKHSPDLVLDEQPLPSEKELFKKLMLTKDFIWKNNFSQDDIENWLSNFKGCVFGIQHERQIALWLLSNFVYYNIAEVKHLCKTLFRDFIHYMLINENQKQTIRKSLKDILKESRFYPLGGAGESGAYIMYYFRQENNLSKKMISQPDKLPNIKNKIFVDDVTISGNQAEKYLKEYIDDNKNIFLLTLISTYESVELLEKKNIKVISCITLDERSKCFSEMSDIFNNYINKLDDCKKFAIEYGVKSLEFHDMEMDPLGYNGGEYTFGFFYNTPNNTLPIFWADNSGWKPIMKRYEKRIHFKSNGKLEKYNHTILRITASVANIDR